MSEPKSRPAPVSLSVLMPALDEVQGIEAAARGVLRAADEVGIDVEVFVITCVDRDGTSDGTVDIVRRIASAEPRVRSVHLPRYQTLGQKFRDGIFMATKEYFVMIPGDNEIDAHSFVPVFRHVGSADIVLCPPQNPEVRSWHRRVLSRAYIMFVNGLFHQRMPYYNGMNVYRTADLRKTLPVADSFALGAETVVRLLRKGCSWTVVPVRLQPRLGRSKALRLDNVLRVVTDLARLRAQRAA